jgi:hypothetical protein
MEKNTISGIDIFTGEINLPSNYVLDRKPLFSSILYNCFIEKNIVNDNNTFKINGSQELSWFHDYIIHFLCLRHRINLDTYNQYGLILYPNQAQNIKNEKKMYKEINYTVIYGLEVEKKNAINFCLHYNNTNHYLDNIYNNKYIIFPSHLNYSLTKNNTSSLSCFLICNYLRK